MKIMSAVLLALLASLCFADTPNDKMYKISLASPSTIGANQLAPGEYSLAVDAASVRVVEVKTGKTVEVPARVETAEKKFSSTAITSTKVDGIAQIREIRLGGSKFQIIFP